MDLLDAWIMGDGICSWLWKKVIGRVTIVCPHQPTSLSPETLRQAHNHGEWDPIFFPDLHICTTWKNSPKRAVFLNDNIYTIVRNRCYILNSSSIYKNVKSPPTLHKLDSVWIILFACYCLKHCCRCKISISICCFHHSALQGEAHCPDSSSRTWHYFRPTNGQKAGENKRLNVRVGHKINQTRNIWEVHTQGKGRD